MSTYRGKLMTEMALQLIQSEEKTKSDPFVACPGIYSDEGNTDSTIVEFHACDKENENPNLVSKIQESPKVCNKVPSELNNVSSVLKQDSHTPTACSGISTQCGSVYSEDIENEIDGCIMSFEQPDSQKVSNIPTTANQATSDGYMVITDPENPTKMSIRRTSSKNYIISPLHSGESDVYDSDADPEFSYIKEKYKAHVSTNNSHASSSSPASSSSSSDSESNTAQVAEANPDPEIVENVKKCTKKRKATPSEWDVRKSKYNRNSGLTYISASKNKKQMSARKLRAPCGDQCRQGCAKKINEIQRQEIFNNYWALGDLHKQRCFISSCMVSIKPKYRYSSTENHRKLNNAFYFQINEMRIRVCKQFFKATLDINDRPIRTIIDKKNSNGFIEPDLRGKHEQHPTVKEEIKNKVRRHIESIPRIESHYLRAQTTREYIDGGRTLAGIWRDYKEECINARESFVNLVMFSKIFNEEYNIGFFVPKKDQCELCTAFQNAEGEDKEKLRSKYEEHQDEKELSRREKQGDKSKANTDLVVAVYDLQAVLPCPRGDVSLFYYRSKLNCYNFSISELNNGNTECFMWHEGEGHRGVEEIASCVYKYIEKIITERVSESIEFIFYSDNCCGQQKNRFMIALYAYALMKFPRISSITHKYLVTGHTQNEGDSVHSTIEKQIKRSLRSGPIYVPSQYAQLVRTAKKRGKPYHVNELSHSDFYSIKSLIEQLKLTFTAIKIAPIRILRIERNRNNILLYKTSYSDGEFEEAKLSRKYTENMATEVPVLKTAYRDSIPLKENKKKDLLSLLNTNHIPKFYADFYNHLK